MIWICFSEIQPVENIQVQRRCYNGCVTCACMSIDAKCTVLDCLFGLGGLLNRICWYCQDMAFLPGGKFYTAFSPIPVSIRCPAVGPRRWLTREGDLLISRNNDKSRYHPCACSYIISYKLFVGSTDLFSAETMQQVRVNTLYTDDDLKIFWGGTVYHWWRRGNIIGNMVITVITRQLGY